MLRLPDDSERALIVGKTGSGKTQAGMWQLSLRSYPYRPWIAIDYKHERLIEETRAIPIGFNSKLPYHPGLYVLRPLPDQDKEVEDFLWRIWQRGGIGLFIDEGFMLGAKNRAYRAILTQGRSKSIPVITCSQRPLFLDRFVISESEFYQVFRLNDARDMEVLEGFIPLKKDSAGHLIKSVGGQSVPQILKTRYNSLWYDVGEDRLIHMKPVPDRNVILANFAERMPEPEGEKWV